MRSLPRRSAVAIVMGLVLLVAGGAVRGASAAQADVAAINKIWQLYTKGVNTGDLDLWISLWDANGIQLAPDAPAVVGKAAIRAKYAKIFPQVTLKIAITNQEVTVAGVWAYSRGTYTLSVAPKAGGETSLTNGKYLTILRKQANGSWVIYRDIFNSNAPPK